MADSETSYILHKVDSIESRLETHVTKIEQRLDQLVHLMQAVATLQEKETRNAMDIIETRRSLKESIEKFDRSVERIHLRLDRIDDKSEQDLDAIFEKHRDLNEKIKETDDKIEKWMNRGIGLWIGISVIVVVLQTVGGVILSSFKDDYNTVKAQIVESVKRQNELEQDITRINNNIRSLHASPGK